MSARNKCPKCDKVIFNLLERYEHIDKCKGQPESEVYQDIEDRLYRSKLVKTDWGTVEKIDIAFNETEVLLIMNALKSKDDVRKLQHTINELLDNENHLNVQYRESLKIKERLEDEINNTQKKFKECEENSDSYWVFFVKLNLLNRLLKGDEN